MGDEVVDICEGVPPLEKLLDFTLDIYSTQRWQLVLPPFFRMFYFVPIFGMGNIERWNQYNLFVTSFGKNDSQQFAKMN